MYYVNTHTYYPGLYIEMLKNRELLIVFSLSISNISKYHLSLKEIKTFWTNDSFQDRGKESTRST
jgi:hypothetical protein